MRPGYGTFPDLQIQKFDRFSKLLNETEANFLTAFRSALSLPEGVLEFDNPNKVLIRAFFVDGGDVPELIRSLTYIRALRKTAREALRHRCFEAAESALDVAVNELADLADDIAEVEGEVAAAREMFFDHFESIGQPPPALQLSLTSEDGTYRRYILYAWLKVWPENVEALELGLYESLDWVVNNFLFESEDRAVVDHDDGPLLMVPSAPEMN